MLFRGSCTGIISLLEMVHTCMLLRSRISESSDAGHLSRKFGLEGSGRLLIAVSDLKVVPKLFSWTSMNGAWIAWKLYGARSLQCMREDDERLIYVVDDVSTSCR